MLVALTISPNIWARLHLKFRIMSYPLTEGLFVLTAALDFLTFLSAHGTSGWQMATGKCNAQRN